MTKELKCIMLVDDNEDDNYFHERAIRQVSMDTTIITKSTGQEGLDYLKFQQTGTGPHPELIFLDINMPGMNGWEFLTTYNALDKGLQSRAIIIMLSTSDNPEDVARANTWNFVSDFYNKTSNEGKNETCY